MKQDNNEVFFMSSISPKIHDKDTELKLREDIKYILSMVKEMEDTLSKHSVDYARHNWYASIDELGEEGFINMVVSNVLEKPEYFFGFIRFNNMDVCLCNNLCYHLSNYRIFHTAPYQGSVAGVSLRNASNNAATEFFLLEGGWTGERIVNSVLMNTDEIPMAYHFELHTGKNDKPIQMIGNSYKECLKTMLATLFDVEFQAIKGISYEEDRTEFSVLVKEWGEPKVYIMNAYSLLRE